MPSFTFQGFSSGSQVALSAAQGASNASGTVVTWGQGSMANISILKTDSGEVVAPAGVWFEAIELSGFDVPGGPGPGETYDRSFHEITYIWDFGDAGDFTAPLNIPDIWKDRNIAYGKRAAHVYRAAGTYTVTLWAVDRSGTTASASTTVSVGDPAQVYAGARTICYSGTGNFAGAPAGAQLVNSASALEATVANLNQSGRVLFRRGSDEIVRVSFGGPTYNQNLRFGAWGNSTDPRPILRPERNQAAISISQDTPVKDRVVEALDFRGDWDPTTETGGFSGSALGMLLSDFEGMMTVLHDCRFSGLRSIDLSTLKPISFTSIVNDCVIEDWAEYGFYAHSQIDGVNDNSRIALIGTAIQQNPDACNGAKDVGFVGLGNQQGAIRYETTRKWIMRSCYCFSNTSWAFGAQPCIRVATDNPGGVELIGDRLTFEGSSVPIELLGYTPNKTGNFLFDRVLLPGSADTNLFFQTEYSGVTLRNALGFMPNVPRLGGPDSGNIVGLTSTPLADPVSIYNSTIIYMMSGTDVALTAQIDQFANPTVENMIHHAPNQNTPVTGDLPLDLSQTIVGFEARYIGRRDSIGRPMVTRGALSAGGIITFGYPTGPDGTTPTSASDFTATGRHWIKNLSTGDFFYRDQGDFNIVLGGSTVTVTNTSGSSWAGGDFYLVLEYLNFVTDPQYASPATVPFVRPQPTSAAFETVIPTSEVALDDFRLQRRPGLPAPGSPSGTASQGCTEPF